MTILDEDSPHFRYIPVALYSTELFIVLIILCIELKTFYYSVFHQQQLQMTIQESTTGKGSSIASPPSPDIECPPVSPLTPTGATSATDKPPPSPRSQTSTSPRSPKNNSSSESKLIFILPMCSYTFFIGAALCGNLSILGVQGCEITGHIGPTCYFIAKLFMYLVFIYRLYIVYSDSAFAYNNKMLLILFIFVIVYTVLIAIINLITLKVTITYQANVGRICNAFGHPILLMATALFDTIISALCCYLFIRPLMMLNSWERNKHATRMGRMILKYVVLTFVAVTSTFLLLAAMSALKVSSLIAIDIVINCFCIALFNKYYHYYYRGICCGAIKLCNIVCKRKK